MNEPSDDRAWNDEQLIADIRQSYRQVTSGLRYRGTVPRARSPLMEVVAPAVLTAVVVLTAGWATVSGGIFPYSHPGGAANSTTATPPSSAPQRDEVVTDHIILAGTRYSYRRERDEASLGPECRTQHAAYREAKSGGCYVALASVRVRVPPGATPVVLDGDRAWVGTDPRTGLTGLYLRDGEGSWFAMLTAQRSPQQMLRLAATARRD
jgi:hypothetical protein